MTVNLKTPQRFCWTKFGTESGETIEEILERKEKERKANGGIFLWGIGNSVAPGIKELVRHEKEPMVLFSPMRSKPKIIDVTPASIVVWNRAMGIDAREWPLPMGSTVVSRGSAERRGQKHTHYALVCYLENSLAFSESNESLIFEELTNLLSGSPLGHSQVTAVVNRKLGGDGVGTRYEVSFAAKLVYPYFVKLFNSAHVGSSLIASSVCQRELEYA